MPGMQEKSDDELVAAYAAGDESAFAVLIERHLPAVYSFAYRLIGNAEEADDVAQDTFVKAWKHLKRFQKGAKMKTWLLSIARNTAIDFLRKKRPSLFSEFGSEDDAAFEERLADAGPSAETRFDEQLNAERVDAALATLPPRYREVVLLHYREGMTLDETARTLGIPLNTAKSRDRRALIALRKLLESRGEKNARGDASSRLGG